ncbi:translation machinery associated TMA7 domain-containing protein [Cordyceps javanica]|uniref:Translation machinery associated TMA7 domain-containing protein n=1 Tax=Cordyceps javanica TaxID=43265 RepID=A0A545UWB5_9HYPO|nr:translation machinery associated TMA7 domain-containing protein [Cordyceps javanica]TQW04540.1 translation machinery associated TMA7 domain-containing protein [Cordyceps javanica]
MGGIGRDGISRVGGKKKPLKAAKVERKDESDESKADRAKAKAVLAANKAAAAELAGGRKLGAGLKKSGKK